MNRQTSIFDVIEPRKGSVAEMLQNQPDSVKERGLEKVMVMAWFPHRSRGRLKYQYLSIHQKINHHSRDIYAPHFANKFSFMHGCEGYYTGKEWTLEQPQRATRK